MGIRISRDSAERLEGVAGIRAGSRLDLSSARTARALAARLPSSSAVSAGRLAATAELAVLIRRRLERYLERYPETLERLLERITESLGKRRASRTLADYRSQFLADGGDRRTEVDGTEALPIVVELLLTWSLRSNPATAGLMEELQALPKRELQGAQRLFAALEEALEETPPPGTRWRSLAHLLRAPGKEGSSGIDAQLRSVLDEWSDLDGGERAAILRSLDRLAEDEAPRFPPGPGPVLLPDYEDLEDESPRFSPDRDWMEELVLMAKNTFVWLDQLSRSAGREIGRLDQIPDDALDELADAGISGLWLIGIWKRSRASQRIKRHFGDAEALASAYSLYDYDVAPELGGVEAARELAERAGARGIRLAADMVPNHMGLDSKWLAERPDLFLSTDECPFPGYRFEGPDLSSDPRVGLQIEDGYYDRSDAAVVFKWTDRRDGSVRFVYHGNDGTSTPWNDTAQLDYLNPETREAVIGQILRVADTFPIIRFDAAMTLARRHVQRLWYPEPGSGGAIPSRSDHSLTRAQMRQAMPEEFWRTVVDRVARERPDTLLLAEAFWLMEGYFVRTLGMHRVYNSAFMNLLRDGETAKLRGMIRDTLDFDPQILKRYVNFLSNPDEESAGDQFGTGERYFGACSVLATLPGLPMIAHGQFSGLHEKYGMEFGRPRTLERPDLRVLHRHRHEVSPLLRRRDQFAGVRDFRLLDLELESGDVNGNVLAYLNGAGTERSVTVFNNSPERVVGHLVGDDLVPGVEKELTYRMRDRTSRLYFLAIGEELTGGLKVDLEPFESRVLVDFRPVVRSEEKAYRALATRLAGRGAPSLELELELCELDEVLEEVVVLVRNLGGTDSDGAPLARAVRHFDSAADRAGLERGLSAATPLAQLEERLEALPWPESERMDDTRSRVRHWIEPDQGGRDALAVTALLSSIDTSLSGPLSHDLRRRALQELLSRATALGPEDLRAATLPLAVAVEEAWLGPTAAPGREDVGRWLDRWVERDDARQLLGLNDHEGRRWIRQEELECLLAWRGLAGLASAVLSEEGSRGDRAEAGLAWLDVTAAAARLAARSGYALDDLRSRLGSGGGASARRSGRPKGSRRRSSRPR